MKQASLISILIPCYNRAHLISETLESIQNQTYTHWECIVVDDGSTDKTIEVVQNFVANDSRIHLFKRPDAMSKGANSCRNFAFQQSKGEFINWFDSDDVMLPTFLEEKIIAMQPQIDIVIAPGYTTDENLDHREQRIFTPKDTLYKDLLMGQMAIVTQSVLFRKTFLEGKPLFNPVIKRGQETELFSRLFFKVPKANYCILDTPLYLHRRHKDSISYKNKEYNSSFRNSLSITFNDNLEKAIEIGDQELIKRLQKKIYKILINAIKNNDVATVNFTLNRFSEISSRNNKMYAVLLKLYIKIALLFRVTSTRIDAFFLNYSLD